MRARIDLLMPSAKQAAEALAVLGGPESLTKRAAVQRSVNKDCLTVVITASDFTALRAMVTSTMRDAKVFIDACTLAKVKSSKWNSQRKPAGTS